MLNNCFVNYSLPSLTIADRDDLDHVDEVDDIRCNAEYVEHQLQKLDTSKANGPDGISAKIQKQQEV